MFGLILIVFSQIIAAFGGVLIRRYLINYNPLLVTSLMAVINGLIFLPILFFGFKILSVILLLKIFGLLSSLPLFGYQFLSFYLSMDFKKLHL
jgi:hypothetical protein